MVFLGQRQVGRLRHRHARFVAIEKKWGYGLLGGVQLDVEGSRPNLSSRIGPGSVPFRNSALLSQSWVRIWRSRFNTMM